MWQLQEGSGQYRYLLNNEPAPVTETWSVSHAGSNTLNVQSEREAPGIRIAVTARIDQGDLSAFDVDWQAGDAGPVRAAFTRAGGGSWQGWRELDGAREDLTLPTDTSLVCYPLMRIFTGSVISSLADLGGKGAVMVPAIGQPQERSSLLLPDVSQRQVRLEEHVSLQMLDGQTQSCALWRFVGGQYTADAAFWLANSGRLLRYSWQQSPGQRWDVWLEGSEHG